MAQGGRMDEWMDGGVYELQARIYLEFSNCMASFFSRNRLHVPSACHANCLPGDIRAQR